MTLPGKLTLGYLEEDIPQKAYFRIKPLLVREEHAYVVYEHTRAAFPDEGGIRIVPDKNESSRFKARMRTLGRYCRLDLTKHPNENEKIRPNKNYCPEKQEHNQYIVYSDVIMACPETQICEVLRPAHPQWDEALVIAADKPGTHLVVVAHQGVLSGPWQWIEVDNGLRLNRDENYAPFDRPEAQCPYLFNARLDDETTMETLVAIDDKPLFARLNAPEGVQYIDDDICVLAESAESDAAEAGAASAEVPPDEMARVDAETQISTPEEEQGDAREDAQTDDAQTQAAPIEDANEDARDEQLSRARDAYTRPAEPVSARRTPVKPVITRLAEPTRPIRPDARRYAQDADASPYRTRATRTPRDNAQYSQTGLNPRRGRSLSEVVDDLWRKSRIDQLGHPVPPEASGQPVKSPIEQAAESARAAWSLPEARNGLLDALNKLDGFADAVVNGRPHKRPSAETPDGEDLNELEAERLKLLGEIDALRLKRAEKRAEIYEEVKQTHARELNRLEADSERLKKECEARLRAAEDARGAHAEAQKLLDKSVRENFEKGFLEYALHTRAAQLIRGWDGADEAEYARAPEVYEPTGAQLVSDVRKFFEDCARPLTNDEAVNLLACVALSRFVLLSGETGVGKSSLARLLAHALGLCGSGARRFVCLGAEDKPASEYAEFRALTRHDDLRTLRMVMLDDINARPMVDQIRGLTTYAENPDKPTSLRVIATVQDDQLGYPLNARLLDRAFFIRLRAPERARGAWKRERITPPNLCRTPSMDALSRAFSARGDVPGDVESRLLTLIDKLGKLRVRFSERTLDDMYAYCASVIPLMTCPPMKVLDYALSQRALPHLLATARVDVIRRLTDLIPDMPMCLNLLNQPLPLPPI